MLPGFDDRHLLLLVTGPWYFQFILRAEVREQLATRADIVALRVLGR